MRGVALSALIALLACDSVRSRCELLPPEQITQVAALAFDGLAVTAFTGGAAERPVYVWSTQQGLYGRATPAGARRIGERCAGGVDAQAAGDRVFVACSRAGTDAGEVLVYELDAALSVRARYALGRAGRDGRGVALALLNGLVHVAFHDGSLGSHAVELATIEAGQVRARRVSRPDRAAASPALLAYGGRLYLAYAELALPPHARGPAQAAIMVAVNGQPARAVLHSRAHDAAPSLAADARGLLLGYRDKKAEAARSELYVVRLDSELRFAQTPRAIGRANADGPPSLHGCAALTAALLPREYGNERFLAVNQLDRELASVDAGHQFYASGRDFVIARGACVRDGLLLLAADRVSPGAPGVEALAMRFQCR